MPIFEFAVWSTSNLIPNPGSTPIATNQINGNRQNNDTFTIGTESSQTIFIEDNENNLFEDNTNTPQFLDQPITIGGFSYPVGTQVQGEFVLETDVLDGDGNPIEIVALRFNPPGSGLTTTAYTLTGPIPEGTTFTITGFTNNPVNQNAPEFASLICFASGTLIRTGDGTRLAIEELAVGDLVQTMDHGPQPIRWIGGRTLSAAELSKYLNLRPIRIAAGAFAPGVPAQELTVSPQHRLLLSSKIAGRMFGTPEILVHAKHLLGLPGVCVAEEVDQITYVHLMCDDHEIIEANGTLAETLYTGTEAMKAMSSSAVQEIEAIFGDLPYLDRPLARPTPKGKLSRKLIERHVKNRQFLVQSL